MTARSAGKDEGDDGEEEAEEGERDHDKLLSVGRAVCRQHTSQPRLSHGPGTPLATARYVA
jgi:hypothetical protein